MTCQNCGAVEAADASSCPDCPAVNPFAAPPASHLPGGYGPPSGFAGPPTLYAPQDWPAKLGLVVPEYAVQTGDLPRVCVVSGEPTENMVKLRWLWAPRWSLIFFVLGFLLPPLFLGRFVAAYKTAGYLPVLPSVRRKYRWLSIAGVTSWVVGIGALFGGAWTNHPLLALLGLPLVPAGIYGARRWKRATRVRRAAPGYLALTKAHPRFVAAFSAGRPAEQEPYSPTPVTYPTTKVAVAMGLVMALIYGFVIVAAVVRGNGCSRPRIHPGAAAVDHAFARSRADVARINARNGDQGLTPSEARELIAEHGRLLDELAAIQLKYTDRSALDSYAYTLRSYDKVLSAAVKHPDAAAEADLQQADDDLSDATVVLNQQLTSVPVNCQR